MYMNESTMSEFYKENPDKVVVKDQTVTTIKFSKILDINRTEIFYAFADVTKYPEILPDHYIYVKVLNQTNNVVYSEEEIIKNGIRVKSLVKHTLIPEEIHSIHVLDGDAKDTVIVLTFEKLGLSTRVNADIQTRLGGELEQFSSVLDRDGDKIFESAIINFVRYANAIDTESEKVIDEIYLDVLHRHADKEGLRYFASLLENKTITVDEIRSILLESDEYKRIKQ